MAGLLVSVRSAVEAVVAWRAGAAVIDVKEPARGPLGAADPETWATVRRALDPSIPVSIALGELEEILWRQEPAPECWDGIHYCKVGLAGMGRKPNEGWLATWTALRRRWRGLPSWVAVVYADWKAAAAPHPENVLSAALESDCAGVLIDTWDKSRPGQIDPGWSRWVRQAQSLGRFVALAGGLDECSITRLAPLQPDLFAVRGAACVGGDRNGAIDPNRVARLAAQVALIAGPGANGSPEDSDRLPAARSWQPQGTQDRQRPGAKPACDSFPAAKTRS